MACLQGYCFSEIAAGFSSEFWLGLYLVFGIFFIAEMLRQTRKIKLLYSSDKPKDL